jgi:hypothetical protein
MADAQDPDAYRDCTAHGEDQAPHSCIVPCVSDPSARDALARFAHGPWDTEIANSTRYHFICDAPATSDAPCS